MSGGTLIALAADQIVMAPSAVLGPVDPQLGDLPAASILVAAEQKDKNNMNDRTLIMADIARKAIAQVEESVADFLPSKLGDDRAHDVARTLSDGRWTHEFPIDVERARSLDLPVSTDLPDEVRLPMRLYPQPRGRRPSVEYIPAPYRAVPDRTPPRRARTWRDRGDS
jgi:ClpP class serine protease